MRKYQKPFWAERQGSPSPALTSRPTGPQTLQLGHPFLPRSLQWCVEGRERKGTLPSHHPRSSHRSWEEEDRGLPGTGRVSRGLWPYRLGEKHGVNADGAGQTTGAKWKRQKRCGFFWRTSCCKYLRPGWGWGTGKALHKVVMPGEPETPVTLGNGCLLPSGEGRGQGAGAALSEEVPEGSLNGEDGSESQPQDPR